jgi:two-component system chemotaxis response regulator CheB
LNNRDIVAIGASAGGVEALMYLAGNLKPNFPAAILVTQHLAPQFPSALAEILARAGPLPVRFPSNGDRAERGTIYLAPPDRHLLLEDERLWLGSGPRENNSRPAIDPMLRSVAACCGSRAIGVVLTGTLGDGASGLWSLGQCGGLTVVQDPQDAEFSEMPMNAVQRARPRHVTALANLPALLRELVREAAGKPMRPPANLVMELMVAKGHNMPMSDMDRIGRRSVFACPDCNGVMWEVQEGDLVHYRCHVGHAYNAELMSLAMDENVRRALATAVRTLEENVALARKLAEEARSLQHPQSAATWAGRASESQQELDVLQGAIHRIDEIAAIQAQRSRAESVEPDERKPLPAARRS